MATSTESTQLIMGAATIWYAPVGTAEPTSIATAPAAGWKNAGLTTDGITLSISNDYQALEADQFVDAMASQLVGREITVATNLAEVTLENLQLALNGGNITSAAGSKSFKLANASTNPTYQALMIEGKNAYGLKRRIFIRKALSVGDVEYAYSKEDQSVYSVEFRAHALADATISLVEWVDEVPASS